MKLIMKRAGAAVPSAIGITLLRDADGDGIADVISPYTPGATRLTDPGTTLVALPAGPIMAAR